MRSMWIIVDDPDGFDGPIGWENAPTVTITDYTYEPLHAEDEVYAVPDGWDVIEPTQPARYVGRHRM